jgi:hypothetical protein
MAYIPFLNNAYFSAKVGIGTDSPSEKLEVQGGNIKIETTTNTDAKLILNSYSSALGSAYQWELVGASSTSNYNFQIREAGQAYVTVDSSVNGNAGYVGIGTVSPSQKLHVSGNARVTGAYYDSTGVAGSPGTAGQVLSSTVTGTDWVTPSSGGGIGGSIASTQIAFGSATANEITGNSGLTYSTGTGLGVSHTTGNGASYIFMTKGSAASSSFKMMYQNGLSLSSGFDITLDGSEDTYMTAANHLRLTTTGSAKDIILDPAGDVGIGTTNPGSKLSVNGGVQVANDADSPVAAKVGTLRYRTFNPQVGRTQSTVEMCVQTGTSTYIWTALYTSAMWS